MLSIFSYLSNKVIGFLVSTKITEPSELFFPMPLGRAGFCIRRKFTSVYASCVVIFGKVGRLLPTIDLQGGDISLSRGVIFCEESNGDVSNLQNSLEVCVFGKILRTIPELV